MALAAIVLSIGLNANPALAATPSKMPVTDWYTAGYTGYPGDASYNSFRVREYYGIVPVARAGQVQPAHFYINQIWPDAGSVAYIGLQKAGTQGRHLFSWWDAIDVYCAGVPNVTVCGSFDNEGSGKTIQMNYDFVAHREYEHQVDYGWQDSVGIWWNSHILDTATGVRTFTGSIKTPLSWGRLQGSSNALIEWFGYNNGTSCDQVPKTSLWRGPAIFGGVVSNRHTNRIGYPNNPCPASVVDHNGGVVQEIGTP